MVYSIAERALQNWTRKKLELLERDGARHRFRYYYRGSICNDGGMPLEMDMTAAVEDGPEGRRLLELAIEPRGEGGALDRACVPGHFHVAPLIEELQLRDQPLIEILARDEEANPAGCFCRREHVWHKCLVLLSTIEYWFEHPECRAGEGGADG